MAPLITLLATYAVARIRFRGRHDPALCAARVALAVMLVLTGVTHFVSTEAMVEMLPPFLPGGRGIVYLTGVFELAVAAMLLRRVDQPSPRLGWTLVAFFLGLLPANIYSAVAEVGLGGHGPAYLWFRVPLQAVFIGWALVATGAVRRRRRAAIAGA